MRRTTRQAARPPPHHGPSGGVHCPASRGLLHHAPARPPGLPCRLVVTRPSAHILRKLTDCCPPPKKKLNRTRPYTAFRTAHLTITGPEIRPHTSPPSLCDSETPFRPGPRSAAAPKTRRRVGDSGAPSSSSWNFPPLFPPPPLPFFYCFCWSQGWPPGGGAPSRHVIDWNEASAFNNVSREGVAGLPVAPPPHLLPGRKRTTADSASV